MQIVDVPPLQIPDGRHADRDEMDAFGETLRKFVWHQESVLDDIASTAYHNEVVDFLNVLANAYNDQLKVFHQAEHERHLRWLDEMTRVVMQDLKCG